MINCKPMTTSRILTLRSYMVVMSNQIWEMPLSFINSFALMFLVNFRPHICFLVSMVSSYSVEPHWIGDKNLLRKTHREISSGTFEWEKIKLLFNTYPNSLRSKMNLEELERMYHHLNL